VPYFATPDIPIWRAAKAGAQTPLLTKGEVNAYSEVEYVQILVDSLYVATTRSEDAIRSFNREYPTVPNGAPDFTKASPQDLRTYLTLLTTAYVAVDRYLRMLRVLIGAELAVTEGKTSLDDLYASERKIAGVVPAEPM